MPACLKFTRQTVIGLLASSLLAGLGSFLPTARAEPPLPARIDALVAARGDGDFSPTSDDAEFVRRVYLDFAGRIPSVIETRAFLADAGDDKRAALIDHLADAPDYAIHLSQVLHVMLMERLGDDEAWRTFLRTSLEENKPWDQFVRQILDPQSDDESLRGAAFFYTKRLEKYGQNPVDMPGLVRDVGRLFLGVDVQCAECHDHLFVDDYKQQTYQGLFAFVGHTFIRRDVEFPAVGENLVTKKIDFKSVFLMEDRATGPRLPGGEEIAIPVLAKGEEYLVPPDKKKRFPGTPAFRPLQLLGQQLPRRGNQAFEANIVNRLWWKLMGRGLVDPLDLHHSENPPSHPDVLALLVEEMGQHDFDVKWMLRQLARTETYQRSSRMKPVNDADADAATEFLAPDPTRYRRALERPLSAEQLLSSMLQAMGPPAARAGEAALTTDKADQTPRLSIDELREKFTAALANPPREPEIGINPTVKAALFLMNDDAVMQLLEPRGNNLIARLVAAQNEEQLAAELYLSVLSRPPSDPEQAEVAQYLASHSDDRAGAAADLTWALLASTEFCVNH